MKIYVNDKPFEVNLYDNDMSILEKWSLTQADSLPQYFRIVAQEDYSLKKGAKLKIEDVRKILRKTSLEKLSEMETLLSIQTDYPYLSKKKIVLLKLWLTYGNVPTEVIAASIVPEEDYIRKIDRMKFHNSREIVRRYTEFSKKVEQRRERIKKSTDLSRKIEKELDQAPEIEYGPFIIEEITKLFVFDLPHGESLVDIFDACTVSETIPFIHLRKGTKRYYKVWQNALPSEEWLKDGEEDGIYFYLRTSSLSGEMCSSTNEMCLSHRYCQGVWYEDHRVEITFRLGTVDENTLRDKFLSLIRGPSLTFRLIQEKQTSVKGKFTISDFPFNKAIFSDMVSGGWIEGRPSILSHFFFFNERQQKFMEGYKSAITKKRFMLYYQPRHTFSLVHSLGIIITPYLSEDGRMCLMDVRVSRAANKSQIDSFQEVFSRLLGVYMESYEAVYNDYVSLLPLAKSLLEKYSTHARGSATKKEDRKSGKRLQELKERRPETFRSGYASMCQPMSHQPYLISSAEEAQKLRDSLGEHKIMEFTDPTGKKDFYACEPREKGEIKTHVFPGLRENVSKNLDYRSQVPFVPCCFTEDQYTKPAAELHRRIEAEKGGEGGYVDEIRMGDTGHILAYNKMVPRGRFGQIPYYFSFVAKSAGYQDIEKGKQSILPIFRYGVLEANDSFLHCMEKAFNPRYSSLERQGRLDLISGVRKELSEMNFTVARQELYDYTDELIREALLDPNHYLDPGIWVRLVEEKYKCNIFLYEISREYPNGAVVIPRFSQAHLFRDISETQPTVFIVRHQMSSTSAPFPFQCELVVKLDSSERTGKYAYVFENDPLVGKAMQFLYDSINIYVTTPQGMTFYAPVQLQDELFQGAKRQYIDSSGKCRALVYDGVVLMTSPLPPFSLPRTKKIRAVDVEKAKKFVRQRQLQVLSADENEGRLRGWWVESTRSSNSGLYYAYIPISESDETLGDKFPLTPEAVLNPLQPESVSHLEHYYQLRKLAEFLQEYTLFEYARDPESFSKDSFFVDPEHVYNLSSLRKRLVADNEVMYRGGKLIVPSDEVRRKLLAFLRVRLLNDTPGTLDYIHRNIVPDYYRSLTDFRKSPLQIIFLNQGSMERWRYEKQSSDRNNVYSVLRPDVYEPYFYRNTFLEKGRVCLVQNVEGGSLERALGVGGQWMIDRVNSGYGSEPLTEKRSYTIYTAEGKEKTVGKDKGSGHLSVLRYSGELYAAILFL